MRISQYGKYLQDNNSNIKYYLNPSILDNTFRITMDSHCFSVSLCLVYHGKIIAKFYSSGMLDILEEENVGKWWRSCNAYYLINPKDKTISLLSLLNTIFKSEPKYQPSWWKNES